MSNYWQGIENVIAATQEVRKRKTKGGRRGVLLALRNVLNVSNDHVPHEEGDLERDGGISMDDATMRGAVSYGRSADTKDYAVAQHERLDYAHDAGRTAKYLENAFNSTRQQSAELIAESIRGEFNG